MGSPTPPQDHKKKTDPRGMQRVKLDGHSRVLRFDSNAIIEACDATGIDDLNEVLTAAAAFNFKAMRALTWAGLLHEDPDLELREVGAWIGDGKGLTPFVDVLTACVAAVNAAVGVDPQETEDAVNKARGAADPTRRGGTGTKRSSPRSQPASDTTSSGD